MIGQLRQFVPGPLFEDSGTTVKSFAANDLQFDPVLDDVKKGRLTSGNDKHDEIDKLYGLQSKCHLNVKRRSRSVTFLGLIIFGCSLMQPLSTGG